ncbi:PIG-L deacetylase family protein [Flagellimonas onchidii]|uniref:PIG-L deacetylase family protein n=1 Tax=Flagellimonas onchidii TaxID=2562684 RepID=UPI0010A5EECA|nr:PIG-L deacetylase family protein [Allomuricauda onchidii]
MVNTYIIHGILTRQRIFFLILFVFGFTVSTNSFAQTKNGKALNILAIGAHPDDCDIRAAGFIKKIESKGHNVKFISLTDGNKGHWRDSGEMLAKRRKREMQLAADVLGVSMEIMNNHDGELVTSLKNREDLVRIIRAWNTDLIIVHGPNELHPDHRATNQLVIDAALLLNVPNYLPEVEHLKSPPIILYGDNLYNRLPFKPEILLPIDDVIDSKLEATLSHFSQFVEGGTNGSKETMPKTEDEKQAVVENAKKGIKGWFSNNSNRYRDKVDKAFGRDVEFVEAFEISPYGRLPRLSELKSIFPTDTHFSSTLK